MDASVGARMGGGSGWWVALCGAGSSLYPAILACLASSVCPRGIDLRGRTSRSSHEGGRARSLRAHQLGARGQAPQPQGVRQWPQGLSSRGSRTNDCRRSFRKRAVRTPVWPAGSTCAARNTASTCATTRRPWRAGCAVSSRGAGRPRSSPRRWAASWAGPSRSTRSAWRTARTSPRAWVCSSRRRCSARSSRSASCGAATWAAGTSCPVRPSRPPRSSNRAGTGSSRRRTRRSRARPGHGSGSPTWRP